jgi:tRNA C32,U32 (ribose-2'-O)-methylase TrmJ
LMDRVGYTRDTPSDRVALSARRVFQSLTPSLRQIDVFRGMIRRINRALDDAPKSK